MENSVDSFKTRRELARELGFMTEEQLSVLAGVKVSTVEDWRKRAKGPNFIRFGSSFYYAFSDVKEYMQSKVSDRNENRRSTIVRSI